MINQLNNMSLEDLIQLKAELETTIVNKQKEKKQALLNDFKRQAAELGLSLDEIIGTTKKSRAGSKVAAKYRNPENADQTWSGRGRQPLWVVEQLAKGKRIEDLAI